MFGVKSVVSDIFIIQNYCSCKAIVHLFSVSAANHTFAEAENVNVYNPPHYCTEQIFLNLTLTTSLQAYVFVFHVGVILSLCPFSCL